MNSLSQEVRTLRGRLSLSQEELAAKLGVSFATVNRWETGKAKPQAAKLDKLRALVEDAGLSQDDLSDEGGGGTPRRKRGPTGSAIMGTKGMEQMLWDAACSIRGEKDAPKFKDYLLPLLFIKRLSDVFDDEIGRLAEQFGTRDQALELVEQDAVKTGEQKRLVRFYMPPEARWLVVSGRQSFKWPKSQKPNSLGEQLTKTVRAIAKHNPSLAGVIDTVDFAEQRSGEREISDSALKRVIETFSDPRYRLGLADVEPDFLGRAYEYLLRKFAEGQGQSAGEFFTPTEVGFLIAELMRPRPGEDCYDYACGSFGLLIKLQLVSRRLNPLSKVPLKLYGQELTSSSYAIARMNMVIHDMQGEVVRGDSMVNPKFRESDTSLRKFDIVVANPMWNQSFDPNVFENDAFDRFEGKGGTTSGRGDWAWLQHTVASLKPGGRAAVVLDTGAVTRGSGSKNEDRERNIRRWFVENDLIDGVILLPADIFYNTPSAGILVILRKGKSPDRRGKVVLIDASQNLVRVSPKNRLDPDAIERLREAYAKGASDDVLVKTVSIDDLRARDFAFLPSAYFSNASAEGRRSIDAISEDARRLTQEARTADTRLEAAIASIADVIASRAKDGNGATTLRRVADCCTLLSGGTPSKARADYWSGRIPWASAKDLKSPRLRDTIDHISEEGLRAGSELAPAQSLLIVVRGMILARDIPITLIEVPMAFNQDLKAIVPGRDLLPEYLLFALRASKAALRKRIGHSAHGTRTLLSEAVEDWKIPVVSLAAQARLAGLLTEADAAIAPAIAFAERRRALLSEMIDPLIESAICAPESAEAE